jgi:hypothetical protein
MVTQQFEKVQLNQVILNGGLPSINFFNGRLLSSEDLNMEKEFNNEGRRRLGRAIGDGILEGLEVTFDDTPSTDPTKAVVHVRPGAAINRNGQYLALPQNIDVSLVVTRDRQPTSAGLFGTCEPPQNTPIATGAGVYILVLSPASGFIGQAQVSGLVPNIAGGTACGSRYKVEGVRFGLVQLDISTLPNDISPDIQNLIGHSLGKSDLASLSMLRNLFAHLSFGTEEQAKMLSNPFQVFRNASSTLTYGVLNILRSRGTLTDCDVPLALLYWTTNGIQFVDMGSVRRRPVLSTPILYQLLTMTNPVYPNFDWSIASASNSSAIGEAVSAQFQEHIEWLAEMTLKNTQSQTALGNARNHFRYLPAAGILPVTGAKSTKGFVPANFFKDIPLRYPLDDGTQSKDPPTIEGAKVAALIREAHAYPPIKLEDQNNLTNQEMIWIYQVRENQQAIAQAALNPPQPYYIFTSGHVPYRGYAQYDIAHWSYGTIASLLDR